MRREKRYRHQATKEDKNVKNELKQAHEVAHERKVKENNRKKFQRKQNKLKGKPNFHPNKTKRMENKRKTNTRVKVIVN